MFSRPSRSAVPGRDHLQRLDEPWLLTFELFELIPGSRRHHLHSSGWFSLCLRDMMALRISVWWSAPMADRGEPPQLLDDAERDRWATLRRPADRAQFAGGTRARAPRRRRAAGRRARRRSGSTRRCPVCGGAHGKPVVVGQPEIGLSDRPCGRVRRRRGRRGRAGRPRRRARDPAQRSPQSRCGVLHPLERDALAALPPAPADAGLPALLDAQGGGAEGDRRGTDDRDGHPAGLPAGRAARGAAVAGGVGPRGPPARSRAGPGLRRVRRRAHRPAAAGRERTAGRR